MNIDQAKAHIELANQSVQAQHDAHQRMLDSQLDAADRIIARKSADTVLEVARAIGADPTQ